MIFAPNGVHDNWHRNEIPTHCPLTDEEMVRAIWHGSDGVKKRNYWNWVAANKDRRLTVLMANTEAVRTGVFLKSIEPFIQSRRYLMIVDESTSIKNPKADISKAMFKLSKNAAYSRILTGTPITQSPLDLWSQCRILDETALPYPSFTAFRREFAVEQVLTFGHRSFNKVVGYQNQELLSQLIAPFTHRVLKKDCLDLPEKIYQTRYVELTSEQKRLYKQLSEQCLATVEPGVVTVTTALTMMLRLQQITLGYVADDSGVMHRIPHHRIAMLKELLEERTGKAIIFVRFKEDIEQVAEALRSLDKQFVAFHGDIRSDGRNHAVDAFQENRAVEYFLCTSAASRGLTLTAAEQMIYYSQNFSLETRLQSEDRAHRIGQTKNVLYTDLVAKGTVDEKVVEALKRKQELANSVLNREQLVQLLSLEE